MKDPPGCTSHVVQTMAETLVHFRNIAPTGDRLGVRCRFAHVLRCHRCHFHFQLRTYDCADVHVHAHAHYGGDSRAAAV